MIDQPFRSALPGLVSPLLKIYGKWGITPHSLTLMGLASAVFATILVMMHQPVWACLAWWVGRLFDGTDGIWARVSKQDSEFGAYLDLTCDMLSYSLMIVGFFVWLPEQSLAWMIILLLYTLCITTALSFGYLLEKQPGVSPTADNRGLKLGAGLAEGGETGLAYTLFLLVPAWIPITVWIWIAVLVATVLSRSLLAFRLFNRFKPQET